MADDKPITDERKRAHALQMLDRSRLFMEDAPIGDVARELVTQGLDLVEPDERGGVIVDALRALWDDEMAAAVDADA